MAARMGTSRTLEIMLITVLRKWPKDKYIIGRLYIDGEYLCNTLEPPWKGNQHKISCIPEGEYPVKWTFSHKFHRYLPEILNVPARVGIRIHRGNYPSSTEGCILPGENSEVGEVHNSTKYEEIITARVKECWFRDEPCTIVIQ